MRRRVPRGGVAMGGGQGVEALDRRHRVAGRRSRRARRSRRTRGAWVPSTPPRAAGDGSGRPRSSAPRPRRRNNGEAQQRGRDQTGMRSPARGLVESEDRAWRGGRARRRHLLGWELGGVLGLDCRPQTGHQLARPSRILDGLTSRWTIPRSLIASSPAATPARMGNALTRWSSSVLSTSSTETRLEWLKDAPTSASRRRRVRPRSHLTHPEPERPADHRSSSTT
jgi:hypothetical protein